MIGGICAFGREQDGALEGVRRFIEPAQLNECHTNTNPGARTFRIGFCDATEPLQTFRMSTKLPQHPRCIQPRRVLHARTAAHALERGECIDRSLGQRLDNTAHEMRTAGIVSACERGINCNAGIIRLAIAEQHCGTGNKRPADARLRCRRVTVRGCGERPVFANDVGFRNRRVHLRRRLTAIERRLEFAKRLIEIAGVAIGDTKVEMRTSVAIAGRARSRLEGARIERQVHVNARQIRVELQRALCGSLRRFELPHVAEHKRQKMLRPGGGFIDSQRTFKCAPGRLGLTAPVQNFS